MRQIIFWGRLSPCVWWGSWFELRRRAFFRGWSACRVRFFWRLWWLARQSFALGFCWSCCRFMWFFQVCLVSWYGYGTQRTSSCRFTRIVFHYFPWQFQCDLSSVIILWRLEKVALFKWVFFASSFCHIWCSFRRGVFTTRIIDYWWCNQYVKVFWVDFWRECSHFWFGMYTLLWVWLICFSFFNPRTCRGWLIGPGTSDYSR